MVISDLLHKFYQMGMIIFFLDLSELNSSWFCFLLLLFLSGFLVASFQTSLL